MQVHLTKHGAKYSRKAYDSGPDFTIWLTSGQTACPAGFTRQVLPCLWLTVWGTHLIGSNTRARNRTKTGCIDAQARSSCLHVHGPDKQLTLATGGRGEWNKENLILNSKFWFFPMVMTQYRILRNALWLKIGFLCYFPQFLLMDLSKTQWIRKWKWQNESYNSKISIDHS